jgi:type I restriction enzyme, S subunit
MSKETFTKRYRLPYTHDLPSEWNYVEIGKVFKESNENNRPDLPLYSVTRTKGIIPQEENNKRDTSSSDKSKYKVIHPGDIVYNTMRMWQGVVALSNVEGIVSPAYTVCTPTEDVYGKYAEYLFKTHPMIKLFHRFSQGLVDDTLSLKYENFKKIFMPLPSFSEQRKIAAILSSVDEAIEKTEAIIEQTEKVKKGLMQQLLTKGIGHTKFKKTEIGEIPEEWEVKTLGELLKLKGGFAFKSSDFVEKGDIPVLRISNIKNNYIDLSDAVYVTNEVANSLNEYLLRENDIVIAMSGATTGKIGRIEKKDIPVLLNQRVGLFKIYQESTLSNDFLYYFAQSKHFQSSVGLNAIGGAQPNISGKQIESVKIGLPSFEEQQQISLILSNIDKKLANEEQRLIQFQAIKKGLMQVLLTGKVRVKVDDEVVSS